MAVAKPKKKVPQSYTTMKARERQVGILALIQLKSMVATELAEILGYNARTVRRDITAMIKRGEAINHAVGNQCILVKAA